MSRPACPSCRSDAVHRSRRSGWERLLGVAGVRPYRCHACEHRFYGRIDPAEDSSSEGFNGRVRAGLLGLAILGVGGVLGSTVYSCTARNPVTPMQASRGPAAPVQAAPVQAAPVQAAPVQAAPVQAAPVQAAPVQASRGPAAPVQASRGPAAFEVQLGAFRSAASAEELEARARAAGLSVQLRRPGRGSRTRLFHVMLSPGFAKQREAEKVADAIRKQHAIKAIVMRVEP